jgi:hypothetical protein
LPSAFAFETKAGRAAAAKAPPSSARREISSPIDGSRLGLLVSSSKSSVIGRSSRTV